MRIIRLYTVLILSVCYSCISEINSEVGKDPLKPVINSFFNPKLPVYVSVSTSKSILDTLGNAFVSDASVYLFKDGVYLDSMVYVDTMKVYITKSLLYPIVGSTYSVNVKIPGFPDASAESGLPGTVGISYVTLDTAFDAARNYDTYRLRIGMNDDASVKNFYQLSVIRSRLDTTGNWSYAYRCFTSDDPVFTSFYKQTCRGAVFTDELFNGSFRELYINTGTRVRTADKDSLIFAVELRNTSYPYYEYNRTLSNFLNTKSDIFAQPAPVYTNVQNGFGIFGGFSNDYDSVWVK